MVHYSFLIPLYILLHSCEIRRSVQDGNEASMLWSAIKLAYPWLFEWFQTCLIGIPILRKSLHPCHRWRPRRQDSRMWSLSRHMPWRDRRSSSSSWILKFKTRHIVLMVINLLSYIFPIFTTRLCYQGEEGK